MTDVSLEDIAQALADRWLDGYGGGNADHAEPPTPEMLATVHTAALHLAAGYTVDAVEAGWAGRVPTGQSGDRP